MGLIRVDLTKLSDADRQSRVQYGLFRAPTLRKPCNIGRFLEHMVKKAEKEMPARDWVIRNMASGRIVYRAKAKVVKPHLKKVGDRWCLFKDTGDARDWPFPMVEGRSIAGVCEVYIRLQGAKP